MEISKYTVFVGHGYLEQAEPGLKGNDAGKYHTYIRPEWAGPKEAVTRFFGILVVGESNLGCWRMVAARV